MSIGRAPRVAVFLDRDGVLNEARIVDGRPFPPDGPDDVYLIEGVDAALEQLAAAGLVLVVVTNQPDVARGTRNRAEIDAVNQWLVDRLPIDDVRVCPHDDVDACECRKPAPGLLIEAAAALGLDLERSVTVGDRWRDIEAGQAAGTATVFVDHGYDERRPRDPDLTVATLLEAVPWILARAGGPQ